MRINFDTKDEGRPMIALLFAVPEWGTCSCATMSSGGQVRFIRHIRLTKKSNPYDAESGDIDSSGDDTSFVYPKSVTREWCAKWILPLSLSSLLARLKIQKKET